MPDSHEQYFARALGKIRALADVDPAFARRLLFDNLNYTGPDANRESDDAAVRQALALCLDVVYLECKDDFDEARAFLDIALDNG